MHHYIGVFFAICIKQNDQVMLNLKKRFASSDPIPCL